MAIGEKSYLTGRARRWFWPGAAILALMTLWSVMSAELYPALLKRVIIEDNTAFLIAGIQTFFHTASLVVFMAVYGLRNKIKAFKIMFLIIGGLYILSAFGHYISNYYVSYILQFHGHLTPVMVHIVGIVSLLLQAAWIAFAVIVIFNRRAGGVLRASAIVLLAAQLASVAYRYGYNALFGWLSVRYEVASASSLTWFLGFVMVLATYMPIIFLLGAMSFSSMKAAPGAAEPEQPEFPQV